MIIVFLEFVEGNFLLPLVHLYFSVLFSLPCHANNQFNWYDDTHTHTLENFFPSTQMIWAIFQCKERISVQWNECGKKRFKILAITFWDSKWMNGIRQWMMREQKKTTTITTAAIIKNSDNFWRREAEKVFPIPALCLQHQHIHTQRDFFPLFSFYQSF